MIGISISDEFRAKWPSVQLGCIIADVSISPSSDELLALIETRISDRAVALGEESPGSVPEIQATRNAYRACGKEPGRYRPSAEALTRRIVSGKGLYKINNVVDLLNLVSIESGFSIGGWDMDFIHGNVILGVGMENEPYEAIGRGELNIAGLPVMRDEAGAFGTPTSDSVRTMVREETKHFLMIYYSFGDHESLAGAMGEGVALLEKFAGGKVLSSFFID